MKAVEIIVPSDKSISHRAVMLASISKGTTRIKNLLMAEDIKHTIETFRAMGVKIESFSPQGCHPRGATPGVKRIDIIVQGVGMRELKKPSGSLYLGNSGTTMRLLPGILAGQDFEVVLTGDESLSARPMKRIVEPLKKMGAEIVSLKLKAKGLKQKELYPPLKIHGGKLKAIEYNSKIASAQVKSCILLAGLYADGVTSVVEPEKSRDHTERMLSIFGCRVKGEAQNHSLSSGMGHGCKVSLKGPVKLVSPGKIEIPGDISSAAFFIVAGCILPGIKIILKNVGLNPTRTGILGILKKMGAEIIVHNPQSIGHSYEPIGDIIIKSSRLKGVTISSKEVVRAIDEIPIIMVAACFARGKTVIKGIEELRVKETDRIKSMVTNLRKMGADIEVNGKRLNSEHVIINGGRPLHGAKVSSFGDHRTAMSMLVASLGIKDKVTVTGMDCINKSFPNFKKLLKTVTPYL